MSLHFICLTATGGLPIFTRKKGDCDTLPFSTVGSLNGVHMFCKSQGALLKNTYLEDGTVVVWKDFENSFTMIGIGKCITEKVILDLLDLAFSAMIYTIGLNEVKLNKNPEQLKRELKNCYPIVDKFIENIDSELLKFSDCIIPNDGAQILTKLNEFSDQIGSPFCCVVISRQKIAAGTEGWWDLNVIDRKLLITTLNVNGSAQVDVPVYLPKKSPNIAYRFICVPICQNVSVCTVCGAEPSLIDAANLAQQIWKNDLDILRNAELCYPRNFSIHLQFDSGILGILLINRMHSKYVMSRNLQPAVGNKRVINTGGHQRLDILRTFFHQAVDVVDTFLAQSAEKTTDLFGKNGGNSGGGSGSSSGGAASLMSTQSDAPKSIESYWCSDYHKCHAYSLNENLICILYVAAIPTHTMRSITHKTLNLILSEKDIVW